MHPLLAAVLAAALGQATPAPDAPAPAAPQPTPAAPAGPEAPPDAPPTPAPPPEGDGSSPAAPPGGFWPAPPPAQAEPSAPAPGPRSRGRVVTLLGGLALGATDQVARRKNGLGALELGLVFDAGPARAGAMLTLGERGGAGAWSASALGGRAFRPSASTALDLLGEVGLLGLWQHGESTLFQKTTVSGGDATLPFAGLRLVLRPGAEPGGAAVALFAHQTLDRATSPYRLTRCGLFGCTTEDKVARYGGLAVGISFAVAWYGRPPAPREGGAGGAKAPPEAPPSAEPW